MSACTVNAKGNTFVGTSDYYSVAAVLAEGSYLELQGSQNVSNSTALTVSDGVSVIELNSNTTVPTVTMPTKLYPTQTIKAFLYNASGLTWGANVTFTGASINGVVATNAPNGAFVYAEFVVTKVLAGSYEWVVSTAKIGSPN
jgi:hypothetical protein